MIKSGMGLVFIGLLATTVSAGPQRPDYRANGSVRVGNKVFATTSDYFQSKTFRDSGARCGSKQQIARTASAAPTDCDLDSTTINPEYNDNRVFIIQTVFHVIKKTDGTGAISNALIQSQIDVLNEDFNALAGTPGAMGHNIKVKFVLARKTPTGQPTTGIETVTNNDYFADPGGDPNNMKQALAWDVTRYFNIYTNDAAGFLGYATFPPYDLGRTATHEVGHWLGLYHTFQDGCTNPNNAYTTGDLLADTPPEAEPTFGCMPGVSCGNVPWPLENYMDYSDDMCMTKFTPEQSNRVRCSLVNYRWINTAPTANFTSTADLLAVTFTNTSTDAETAATALEYKWTFGDGMTSTEANPMHTYAADGTYDVKLEVWDPGSGASAKTQSLTVSVTPGMPDAGPTDGDGGVTGDGATGDDAGTNPTEGDGGGCCETGGRGSATTMFLCGIPLVLVLRRRRRA